MKKFTQIAGIAGVVVLVLGSVVGLVQQRLGLVVIVHLSLGGALVLMGLVANAREIKEALARRAARVGPQVALQGLIIVVILFLVNVLVYRHDYVKDMTRRSLFTFSRATKDVAANLPGEIQVIAFLPGGKPAEARQRLILYDRQFDKVDVRLVDPDKNEEVARAEGIPPRPGVLFKYRQEKVWITKYQEMDITNALIKVTREKKPKVMFTTGHAEPGLDSDSENGLSYLKKFLEQQGYVAQTADLSKMEEIPDEFSMVAIVGPAMAFSRHEVEVLDYFIASGGNAIIFMDPVWESGTVTGLENFVQPYGLEAGWNLVFDPENHLAGDNLGLWIVTSKFFDHPITQGMTQKRAVFYMPRSLEQKEHPPPDTNLYPLVQTSDAAYAKSLAPMKMQSLPSEEERSRYISSIMSGKQGQDSQQGPFVLAYALERRHRVPRWKRERGLDQPSHMRLVVMGTSVTCRNVSINMPYNYELVMNSFNWLAGEEDLKVIRPPQRTGIRLYLDQAEKDWVLYVSVMILPEALMIIGLAVWWRRR